MASEGEYLESVNEQARQLVDESDRAYVVGLRIWKLGMEGCMEEESRRIAEPIWLMWGNLTDRVDGPGGNVPGSEAAAAAAMRRAATEWLALPADRATREAYFDRWIHEECGYKRKTDEDAPQPES